ncbi:defensin-like protein 4 [Brassica napus]|uniref:defensin-like protein 4 n=1 Tax=Brassica napus TaxID=3708 RepID=UPI0006AAFD8C|nr:defensin-like protein 4 [Brassica napus]
MSKFATIITLLFAYFVLFTTFESATTVEGQRLCTRQSRTWWGVCGNNDACRNQCIRLEGARHGSCNYIFPYHRCICYHAC